MWRILTIALFICSANAQNPLAKTSIAQTASQEIDYVLPKNLKPTLYEIELEPNFDTDTFNGSVRITISVTSTTNEIVLHTNELEIDIASVRLLDENGNVVNSVSGTSYSEDDRQFYTITFEENLEEGGTYVLAIGAFTGILNSENDGFYLARYTNEDGVERKLATTQFEATSARRAFPCFDEPALKAQFDITMIRPAGYDSISNMPKISTHEISEGRFQDKFERTVNMSTYLVAFVVSDFTYVEKLNQRVFGRSSLIVDKKADYALETGLGVLDVIAEFLDVSYSLPKMDQIGLPDGYFSSGAMENWGLVTYREAYLMFTEGATLTSTKQSITTVISHEFGHQWFGNLVSPQWWSYIWLNEGFATYFEYYGASIVYEDMDLMNQMLIRSVHNALLVDSYPYSRPMNYDVGSPRDISSVFDTIAYDKSGSVIRMIEGILSTEVFRRGLNIYLNKMQFSAAQPGDLYSSWEQAMVEANVNPLPEGEDLASVLSTWDSNAGHPLVTVIRNYTDGSVTLSQRKFIITDINNTDETIWYVPISYATTTNLKNNPSPDFWLTTRNTTVDLADLGVDDFLLVNIQERGYYRVNYDVENWRRIIEFLKTENFYKIDKLNRAQLFDDSYVFAQYDLVDYSVPMGLTEYVVRETDYVPLYPFFTFLNHINRYMENIAEFEKYRSYILTILNAATESVGFDEREDDRHVTKLNRINVLTWVCRYGRQDCREYALGRLREWAEDESKRIVPDLQTVLVCSGLRLGEQSDWDFVYRKYLSESDSAVRSRIFSGLGCAENEDVLNGYVKILLDPESALSSTERSTAWSSIINAGNHGRDFVYSYVKSNWSTINSSLTSSQLSSLLSSLASRFSSQEQFDDIFAFAQEVGTETFLTALGTIQRNVVWSDAYLPPVLEWLNTV